MTCTFASATVLLLIGDRAVLARERLMGLILVAVSVEMMIRGLKALSLEIAR